MFLFCPKIFENGNQEGRHPSIQQQQQQQILRPTQRGCARAAAGRLPRLFPLLKYARQNTGILESAIRSVASRMMLLQQYSSVCSFHCPSDAHSGSVAVVVFRFALGDSWRLGITGDDDSDAVVVFRFALGDSWRL